MVEDLGAVKSGWRISLIITTYNSAVDLALVLASIQDQTVAPIEIIIADDGSETQTRDLILKHQNAFPCRLIHSWQPDRSFRLSRSRNLAALKASGDWLLFIDGDCLMPPQFIETHQRLAESRHLIFGARKLLGEINANTLRQLSDRTRLLKAYFSGKKFWRLPVGLFRTYPRRSWGKFRGFLMGIDADLYRSCGGFDESFRAWGLEDSDFAIRAIRAGASLKDGRYANAVLHLYHPEPSKDMKSSNEMLFIRLKSERDRFLPNSSVYLCL
jgi:glycosyltransferase involved in cell wall biosynthesis